MSGSRFAEVIKTEEKGSDVNLATHLLHDGHLGRYESAVIVTNDSDLAEAIKIVRRELNLVLGMINPNQKPSYALKKHVAFIKKIRKGVLRASQFPNELLDAQGTFHKASDW